jgi:hypothetical protein
MDSWERLFREEGETLAFFLREEFRKALDVKNQYWQHKTSGEIFAVQVEDKKVIFSCGPLHYSEATAANLNPWNFNDDPEQTEMLNLTFDEYRVIRPFDDRPAQEEEYPMNESEE